MFPALVNDITMSSVELLSHKPATRMMAGGCTGESAACTIWAVKHLNSKAKAKSTVANLSMSSKK